MGKSAIEDVSTAAGPRHPTEGAGRVLTLTIASHPSAHRVGERYRLDLARRSEVALSRNEPEFARPGRVLGAPLGDPFVSRRPIRISALEDGRLLLVVEPGGTPVIVGRASGAGVAVNGRLELAAQELASGVVLELAERVVVWLQVVEGEPGEGAAALGMVGESVGIRQVRTAIERIVDLEVPVLIRGETGTGKELVARAIHERSPRRSGPFVSVNLGAIPRELAAAELFGATRGAFTGAVRDREGLFRAAHQGTLFLDEVGEAPPEVQVMLLRVLETGQLYPVGADKPVSVQVRLVAATDANLEQQIRDGKFKAPLLHRLAGYEVRLPPLRERRDDIGPLFYHFAREELTLIGEVDRLAPADPYAPAWLPASVAAQLLRHRWPGNIRQLRNLTRQLVIGSRGHAQVHVDPLLAEELAAAAGLLAGVGASPEQGPGQVGASAEQTPQGGAAEGMKEGAAEGMKETAVEAAETPPGRAPRRKPSQVSELELMEALRACAWDLQAAADRLRIPRPSMYDLIDKHPSIRTAGSVSAQELTQCFADCGGDLDAMAARLQVSRRALTRRVKELGLGRRPG